MIKLLLIVLLLFPIMGNGDTHATVALGNPDLMSRSCASGFTRLLPNYCQVSAPLVEDSMAMLGTCQTFSTALLGVPTGTIAVSGFLRYNMLASNVVAQRTQTVQFYSDNTCTTLAGVGTAAATREWVAVGAGSMMIQFFTRVYAIPIVGGTNLYYIGTSNACASCQVHLYIDGYFD